MYDRQGLLQAHGKYHDSFGMTFADIFVSKQNGTRAEGEALHNQFLTAVTSQESAFVQYDWKNSVEGDPFTKIAFLVRVVFESELYYIGAGFNFALEAIPLGPLGTKCSAKYNLPCSFDISLQLSSHAVSHAISSPLSVPGWR
jgi:hypothetical protein